MGYAEWKYLDRPMPRRREQKEWDEVLERLEPGRCVEIVGKSMTAVRGIIWRYRKAYGGSFVVREVEGKCLVWRKVEPK